MRKFVKLLCLALIVATMVASLSGCVQALLVGAWENDKTNEIFVLDRDGTVTAYLEDGTVTEGTYSFKTDIRYIYVEVENNTFKEGKGYEFGVNNKRLRMGQLWFYPVKDLDARLAELEAERAE